MKKDWKAPFRTRSWRAGAYSALATVLVIAIAVVAVLAVSALPSSMTQLDMTREGMYSISQGTEQLLAALDRDVDIYWLAQAGHEDSTLEQVLGKYAEYSRVTVTEVDPVRYPGFAGDYTDEQVSNNSVIVAAGDKSMYIPFSDIWTYSDYDTYSYYYYNLGQEFLDVFAGEGKITSAIRYVTSDELPVMYFLTGHGESGPSEAVLGDIALENVRTETLNLVSAGSVPEDCAALGIIGPASDITVDELKAIRDYLDGGGRLLMAAAYTTEETPNLEALLLDVGLELRRGCVLESDSRYYQYGYIDLVLPSLGEHEITAPLREGSYTIMMPDAQGLAIADDEDVTVTPLLTTSDGSYLKAELEGQDSYEKSDGDLAGPFMLGAAADNDVTGAQAVAFTSAAFMEPEYSDTVAGANLDLFLNAVDFLCQREDAISIHPKIVTSDYLSYTDSVASVLKLTVAVIVPALFLGAGLVIFIRRRRR